MKREAASEPVPDVVRRAAAILAEAALPRGARPAPGPVPLPDLRQRAMELVADLFAALGPAGGSTPALASAALPAPLSTLLWHRAPSPTRAGERVELPLQADNGQGQPVQTGFYSSDLLSDDGHAIPSHRVSFDPPRFTVGPRERTAVSARIQVPLQTVPGLYSGLIQAAGLPASKVVITIEVA